MADALEQIKAARTLLDTGYDNGFGVTSLDTLLCEQMDRCERIDFAAFLLRTAGSLNPIGKDGNDG